MALSEQQIRALKQRLEKRFYELREEIRQELLASEQATYIELAGQVHDTGDAAVATLLEDVELASVDRHVDEIRAIDAALMRIAKGRYGYCIDCEQAIEAARLESYPTALRCHDCQARWEQTHASKRGPSL
jgi:RNA polymerase-binding protein DksA